MANPRPRTTRFQKISPEAQQIMDLGESDLYEFKRDVQAVKPGVLAALANAVALDATQDCAHLLVGVEEVEETSSGLVRGRAYGLPRGLDRAVSHIQDVASRIRPVPVNLFIIEEGVKTDAPFVRLEIRPAMPPHFDDEGRRQTRQGRSTRALTDEELLQIYLQREATNFGDRYRQASAELRAAVGGVGAQVDSIAEAIDQRIANPIEQLSEIAEDAASTASVAASAAQEASSEVNTLTHLVRDLQDLVESVRQPDGETLAARVASQRKVIWWYFIEDTWRRSSDRALRTTQRLHSLLTGAIPIEEDRNSWELCFWRDILHDRSEQPKGRGTLKWWDASIQFVSSTFPSPSYQALDLPDLAKELRTDLKGVLDDPLSLTNQFADDLDL